MSSMAFIHFPFLLVIFFSIASPAPTAYDVLKENDFPVGLLPEGVTGHEISRQTGEFSAYLNRTCSFLLENSYQLKYETTITGVISKGIVKNLKGVSVKVLLLWLNIVEVSRTADHLQFSVGVASPAFPVGNFLECPKCGSGLSSA